jgi:hypothetical protein
VGVVDGLGVLGVLVAQDAVAHLHDVAPILLRHAQDFGEDLHGYLRGDLLHEIELALGERLGEDPVADRVHGLLPDSDGAGGEAACDQLPQLRVARRVRVDHGFAGLDLVLVQVLEAGPPHLRRIRNEVAVHGADVPVARDGVEAGTVRLRVEVHGGLVAQGAEPLVGHPLDEGVVAGEVYLLQRDGLFYLGHLLLLTKRLRATGFRLQENCPLPVARNLLPYPASPSSKNRSRGDEGTRLSPSQRPTCGGVRPRTASR